MSISKSTRRKRAFATHARRGNGITPNGFAFVLTVYTPGASRMRYRPSALVRTRATAPLLRRKVSVTPAAGPEQGTSVRQTGWVGPFVTVPKSPLGDAAPATAPVSATMTIAATAPLRVTPTVWIKRHAFATDA